MFMHRLVISFYGTRCWRHTTLLINRWNLELTLDANEPFHLVSSVWIWIQLKIDRPIHAERGNTHTPHLSSKNSQNRRVMFRWKCGAQRWLLMYVFIRKRVKIVLSSDAVLQPTRNTTLLSTVLGEISRELYAVKCRENRVCALKTNRNSLRETELIIEDENFVHVTWCDCLFACQPAYSSASICT